MVVRVVGTLDIRNHAVRRPGQGQDGWLEEDGLLLHEAGCAVEVTQERHHDQDGSCSLLERRVVVLEVLCGGDRKGDEQEDELEPESPGRPDGQNAENTERDQPGGEEEAEEFEEEEGFRVEEGEGTERSEEDGPETEVETCKGAKSGRAKGVACDEFEDGRNAHHDSTVHKEGSDKGRRLRHALRTQVDQTEQESREGEREESKGSRVGQSSVREVSVMRGRVKIGPGRRHHGLSTLVSGHAVGTTVACPSQQHDTCVIQDRSPYHLVARALLSRHRASPISQSLPASQHPSLHFVRPWT